MSGLGAELSVRDRVVQIVDDEEIEQAVVVEVEPSGGDGPRLAEFWDDSGYARFRGDIGEGAIAVVVEELIAVHAGDVEVDEAIVVVIASGNAHGVAGALESCFFGHVGEGAVTVVTVETIPIARIRLFEGGDCGAVGEEDIQKAVVVEVEESYAPYHGFESVALGAEAVLEDEIDFGSVDCVFELDWEFCGGVF